MTRKSIVAVFAACGTVFAYTGADLSKRPVNTWIAYPNTQLIRVTPSPIDYPNIQGVEGQSAIINDWCGGAFDSKRNRLIVWGGGHNGYYGNELYAFDVDSLRWERLTDPCPNPTLCAQTNPDGSPASRHTYNGLAYIAHADRFFACGGAWACPGGGGGLDKALTFDFSTLKWRDMAPAGSVPPPGFEESCAYDPGTRKVYYFNGSGYGFYSYDYDANRWSTLSNEYVYGYTCAVDTKRHRLMVVGNGNVYTYDLTLATPVRQTLTTTGGAAFISQHAPGLAYDPVSDRVVGWHGGAVYALNPDTREWTAASAPYSPQPNMNGTYGRWQYVPKYNIFVVVNRTSENVYFYKLSAGLGTAGVEGKDDGSRMKDASTLEVAPNPFRGRVSLVFSGAAKFRGTVKIHTLAGRLAADLSAKVKEGRVAWDASGHPPGLYLVTAGHPEKNISKKIFLLN